MGVSANVHEQNDFVFLTVRLENQLKEANAHLQTPVQVALPNSLDYADVLVIVKNDADKHKMLQSLQDVSGLGE